MKTIYKICSQCYGHDVQYSICCDAETDNQRCSNCGKFCKTEPCSECNGFSPYQIKINDTVQVFVYKNSPKYLIEQFNKRINKSHIYYGKVIDIFNNTLVIKTSTRTLKVDIQDVDVY